MSHEKIAACDRQSEAYLGTCAERQDHEAMLPQVRPRQRTRHRPRCDVRGTLPRVTGVDLTAMEGIDEPPALTRISASGLDRGRGPTVKHCTSWLGLCPHHRDSGGQV
jgi:transposase